MRERIRDIDRLRHIEECINHVNDFLHGKTIEDMKSDVMCYHAVVYNIMIIGEAANMLTLEFRENHPETPWRQITGMRNFLIHGYHQVEKDIVWKVIEEDLLLLRPQIVGYLTAFGVSAQ
jgi:uncharacterized protein with HEPN domain